jgi:hypothetical protein
MTHLLQCFATHGDGKTMAIPRREGSENQANIGAAGDVI